MIFDFFSGEKSKTMSEEKQKLETHRAKHLKIIVASKSHIKKEAVESSELGDSDIVYIDCRHEGGRDGSRTKRAEQPINEGGIACAMSRLNDILELLTEGNIIAGNDGEALSLSNVDFVVVMENYIQYDSELIGGFRTVFVEDFGIVILYHVREGFVYQNLTKPVRLPDVELFDHMMEKYEIKASYSHELGTSVTYGKLLNEKYPHISHDNWMEEYGFDRRILLKNAIDELFRDFKGRERTMFGVSSKFRYYDDFPKPGVKFMDWSDIFLDSVLLGKLIDHIADKYKKFMSRRDMLSIDTDAREVAKKRGNREYGSSIDYVFGLESRGYLIALPLAQRLGCAFVPLRKPGKLPEPKLSIEYTKEYGTDTLELRNDLPKGNVLIVDDVLATGGSLQAAAYLAMRAGHNVVDCIVITDVPSLRQQAAEKLKGFNIRVIAPK